MKDMKQEAAEILKKALKLPPEARAALIGSLLDSLDEIADEEVDAAWETEITRRLAEARSEDVPFVPWSEARRRILGN